MEAEKWFESSNGALVECDLDILCWKNFWSGISSSMNKRKFNCLDSIKLSWLNMQWYQLMYAPDTRHQAPDKGIMEKFQFSR